MNRNLIETVMGAVVLIIAAGFLYSAYKGRNISAVSDGYEVSAMFENVSGIEIGSDVRLGGVKIGVVKSMGLDEKRYQAVLSMIIKESVAIPADSTAAIIGDGLLGSKFVAVEPGADDAMLKDGGSIEFTQSSVSLEELIGKFVFSGGGVDKEDTPAETAAPNVQAAPANDEDDELSIGF